MLVLVVAYEAQPELIWACADDGETQRLGDWLTSSGSLSFLEQMIRELREQLGEL